MQPVESQQNIENGMFNWLSTITGQQQDIVPSKYPSYEYDSKNQDAIDVGTSLSKVVLGAAKGRAAISRLYSLSNNDLYGDQIKGAIKATCMVPLMSDDETKRMMKIDCASLQAKMSNGPVTFQDSDATSGEPWGKETFVMVPSAARLYRPDQEIAKFRAGANYIFTNDGGNYVNQDSFSALV